MNAKVRPDAIRERHMLTLVVTDVRDEAAGIRSFELRDPEGGDLPPFEAGAHIQVEVELPDGRTEPRHYSLFGDPPDRTRYRIAVLLEIEGRGGSRFMHERVALHSRLRVTPPVNAFPLVDADRTILIAGGIGITPILSMMWTLARHGRSYELHYAARTPERMAFREVIEKRAGENARFYLDSSGPGQAVDLKALFAAAPPRSHVYVCGPRGLIDAVTAMGREAGWDAGRIHSESFGVRATAADLAIDVRLERSALTLRVAPGESILDAVLDAGVWAPFECRRGSCGSCMTRVLDGRPDHRDSCLTDQLRATHICLCVSRAQSTHLTLDL